MGIIPVKEGLVNSMEKNPKKRLVFSLLFASGISIFNVLHEKFGTMLAGGVYSAPHSWQEIYNRIPSFLGFFCIVFIFAYLILYYKFK